MQYKILAKVDPPNLGVVGKFLRATRLQDTAVKEQVCPICDAQRLMHIVVRYQDPDIAILKMRHNPLDIFYRDGIHPCEWFVE